MPGKAANSPKTGTGRHELPTELETPLPAALYLNLKSVRRRICGHGAQRGANRTPSAHLSAAAPHPQEGFPEARPASFPQEGFPKGRAAARPFVSFQGGAGGNRNPPRDRFLFAAFSFREAKEKVGRQPQISNMRFVLLYVWLVVCVKGMRNLLSSLYYRDSLFVNYHSSLRLSSPLDRFGRM